MTLRDPAGRPCADPDRPCSDPGRTLRVTLSGSTNGVLACGYRSRQGCDPAVTLSILRGAL